MLTSLFILSLAAMAGDVVVTDLAIKNGAKEGNPILVKLFGKYPEAWELAVAKVPAVALAVCPFYFANAWPVFPVLIAAHVYLIVRNWEHI